MRTPPLSPGEAIGTRIGAALAVLSVVALAYSVVIAGQLLVGVFVVVLLASTYLWYRLFHAIERVADGLQRLADAGERIAEGREGERGRDRTAGAESPDRERAGPFERE